jgi:hypothetical protein
LKVYTAEECPQGSDTWFEVRKGIPTASRFDRILTPKKMKLSGQVDGLIAELIGEKFSLITPENVEHYTNRAMRWGEECEAEARRWYSLEVDEDVVQVGFCLTDDGRFGCSPDALVGKPGGLELKCPTPKVQVEYLLAGVLPDEYMAQVHGNLIVTEREWWDFVSYSPGLPPFRVRVVPNSYTRELRVGLEMFWEKFQEALARGKSF